MRKNNINLAFMSFIFKYGLGLISYPIFLHYLNTTDAGIYFLILNSGALFDILDLNFKNSLVIQFSQAEGSSIDKGSSSLLTYSEILVFSKFFYSIVCIVAMLVVGVGFAIYLYFYLLQKGFAHDYIKYLSIWSIFCISSLLQVYYTYLSPALTSKGHINYINKLSMNTKLLGFVVQILFLLLGLGLFALALSVVIATIYERFSIYKYYSLVISESRNMIRITFTEFKQIFTQLWETNYKLGLVSIAIIMNTRLPAYFVGMLHISAEQITAYLFTMQLVGLIFAFSHVPIVNNFADLSYYFVQDKERFVKIFKRVNKSSLLIYVFFMFSFILLGPWFIKLIGIKHSILSMYLLSIVGVTYFFEKMLLNYTTIICVTNKIPMYKSFIISSLLIVILQITLVHKYDTSIISVILPQLIVQIGFNYWFWTLRGIKMINSTE